MTYVALLRDQQSVTYIALTIWSLVLMAYATKHTHRIAMKDALASVAVIGLLIVADAVVVYILQTAFPIVLP